MPRPSPVRVYRDDVFQPVIPAFTGLSPLPTAMDPKPTDTQAFDDADAAPVPEQRPATVVPATFRAVEKLNPDLEPFIFFGF